MEVGISIKSGRLMKMIGFLCGIGFFCGVPAMENYSYAVVISSAAYSDEGWKTVADSLVKRHNQHGTARLVTWTSSVSDAGPELTEFQPDYIGYIARPVTECNAAFIVAISRLSRKLDADPYGDAVWGIITGYEAADALRTISESLTVKTVLAASSNLSFEPPIERFYQGIGMTCDSYTKTDYLFAGKGGTIFTENKRPENEKDRIKLVSRWLNAPAVDLDIAGQGKITEPIDCIITGGHGNVNLWQCHYPEADGEGYLQSNGGKLLGAPASGTTIAINAPTPKIFWCASNCLMGNPDNKNNIVYAAFHTGHAVQMFGFVNSASSGDEFMAWGVYDRVTKSAGKYTLPEGYFLSNNNALFELEHPTGQMNTQMVRLFMDSTALYGDPAADVQFHDVGDSARAYTTNLTINRNATGGAEFTFAITMQAHDLEFGEGYCYQFRPMALLPVRIDPATAVILQNDGHLPVITDNLIIWEMLSTGEKLAKGKSKSIRWSATITHDKTSSHRGEARRQNVVPRIQLSLSSGNSGAFVRLGNSPAGPIELQITDIAGRNRFSGNFISDGSLHQLIALKTDVVPGTYLLRYSNRNTTISRMLSIVY